MIKTIKKVTAVTANVMPMFLGLSITVISPVYAQADADAGVSHPFAYQVSPQLIKYIQSYFGVPDHQAFGSVFANVKPFELDKTSAWLLAQDDSHYWKQGTWNIKVDEQYQFDESRVAVLLNISRFDSRHLVKQCASCPGMTVVLFLTKQNGRWQGVGKPKAIRAVGTNGFLSTGAFRYRVNGVKTDNPFFHYQQDKVAFTLAPQDMSGIEEHKGLMLFSLAWLDVKPLSDYIPIAYEITQKRLWDGRFVDWLERSGVSLSAKQYQRYRADSVINVAYAPNGDAIINMDVAETFDITDRLPTVTPYKKINYSSSHHFNPPEISLTYQWVNGKFKTTGNNPIPTPKWAK